jgi:hypothetical protein
MRVMTPAARAADHRDMAPHDADRPAPSALHQTVQIRKGWHESPARGACVIELASMLAGEPFSDHPESVCPVIAAFLRGYNDLIPDAEQDELYAYAALVVGSTAPRAVRRARARRLLLWAGCRGPLLGFRVRARPWDLVLLPAVESALRMPSDRRPAAVLALIEELCAMGREPAPELAEVPAAERVAAVR